MALTRPQLFRKKRERKTKPTLIGSLLTNFISLVTSCFSGEKQKKKSKKNFLPPQQKSTTRFNRSNRKISPAVAEQFTNGESSAVDNTSEEILSVNNHVIYAKTSNRCIRESSSDIDKSFSAKVSGKESHGNRGIVISTSNDGSNEATSQSGKTGFILIDDTYRKLF